MILLRILSSDWIKLRRTWISFLTYLGPFGIVALTWLHYVLAHYQVNAGQDDWQKLLFGTSILTVFSLLLVMALVASIYLGIEHQGSSWKQLLALPISRVKLYLGKFIWLTIMLARSSFLLMIGIVLLGKIVGIHAPVPWKLILINGFAPFLAALPILALQVYLSTVFSNQAFPII